MITKMNYMNKYSGTYYVMFPGETMETDSMYDVNQLGNGTTGNTFYFEKGFVRLQDAINSTINSDDESLINSIHIYNPSGKEITLEKFVNIITKHYTNRVM